MTVWRAVAALHFTGGGYDRLRNRRRFLLLLPDLTLAGRAGGVIVYVREGDDREAGQGEHRLIR